jgi:fermentation-respiration switch protein FrsA (DUF1100 family)
LLAAFLSIQMLAAGGRPAEAGDSWLKKFEKANLYFPDKTLALTPSSLGWTFSQARFSASDGTPLHGWLIAAGNSDKAVLIFHGNAGNVSHRLEKSRLFLDQGFSVFLFDYRGYGESGGSPDEAGTYLDGAAAAAWLRERGFPARRTAYYGESLGCAVALQTALDQPPAALVLDGAFTSTADMARKVFPILPLHRFVSQRYDNLSKIHGLKVPVMFIHGPDDEVVPFEMGRRLFDAAPEPKRFLRSSGGHNDSFLRTPGWAEAVGEFLRAAIAQAL